MSDVIAPYLNNFLNVIINPLIQLLFFVAFIYFAFGVVKMVANPGDENKRKEGKAHLLWGVVGMVIMLGVFGIMQVIGSTITDIVI